MNVASKTENSAFRMLYILAIFMIIDGHLGSYDYLAFDNLLRYQNYHVALFVFASGYFLKLERSYKDFFIRKFTRIILPLYGWNICYGILCWYLNTYQGFSLGNAFNLYNIFYSPIIDGHQFIYNLPSWFLVPFFLVQISFFLMLKPFASSRCLNYAVVLVFVIALLLGGFALSIAPTNHGERNLMLTLLRTLYFFPSFAFGIFYRHILEKYDTLNTPVYLCSLLFFIYIMIHTFLGYDHIPAWLDHVNESPAIIYIIIFAIILFWLRIAKVLAPVMEQSKYLNYIAHHTFDLMMHHFIGFMLIKAAWNAYGELEFNSVAYKSNIWYNYFPFHNERIDILYIIITIVIALLVGFTSRKICGTIIKILGASGGSQRHE